MTIDEMDAEDRNTFRTEMQKRFAAVNATKKKEFRSQIREKKEAGMVSRECGKEVAWQGGYDPQFYFDAHREFLAQSWMDKY